MARKRRRGRRRCRYYVNTNFFIDLEEGRREALEFAERHRGELCTSRLLVDEYRAVGKGYVAKRLAKRYGIRIIKVRRTRYVRRALEIAGPRAGINTVIDVAHILVAKRLRAAFVTSDKRACRRAVKMRVGCIDYRRGEAYAPS